MALITKWQIQLFCLGWQKHNEIILTGNTMGALSLLTHEGGGEGGRISWDSAQP